MRARGGGRRGPFRLIHGRRHHHYPSPIIITVLPARHTRHVFCPRVGAGIRVRGSGSVAVAPEGCLQPVLSGWEERSRSMGGRAWPRRNPRPSRHGHRHGGTIAMALTFSGCRRPASRTPVAGHARDAETPPRCAGTSAQVARHPNRRARVPRWKSRSTCQVGLATLPARLRLASHRQPRWTGGAVVLRVDWTLGATHHASTAAVPSHVAPYPALPPRMRRAPLLIWILSMLLSRHARVPR